MKPRTYPALLALALAAITLPGTSFARSSSTEAATPALSLTLFGSDEIARRGRGADDGAGHVRGGHGTDDGAGHTAPPIVSPFELSRRGRGADDGAGHVRRGRGKDDGPNHT